MVLLLPFTLGGWATLIPPRATDDALARAMGLQMGTVLPFAFLLLWLAIIAVVIYSCAGLAMGSVAPSEALFAPFSTSCMMAGVVIAGIVFGGDYHIVVKWIAILLCDLAILASVSAFIGARLRSRVARKP